MGPVAQRQRINLRDPETTTNYSDAEGHVPSFVEQRSPRGFHDLGIGGRWLHQSVLKSLDAPACPG